MPRGFSADDDGQLLPKDDERRTPIMLAGMCANGSHDECAHTPMTCECKCHRGLVEEAGGQVGMTTWGIVSSRDWAIFTRAVDARRLTMNKSTVTELAAEKMGIRVDSFTRARQFDLDNKRAEQVVNPKAPQIDWSIKGDGSENPSPAPAPASRHENSQAPDQAEPVVPVGNPTRPEDLPPGVLECPVCQSGLSSFQGLTLHLQKAHGLDSVVSRSRAEEVWENTPDEKRPWIVCERGCGEKFKWGAARVNHKCVRRFTRLEEDEPEPDGDVFFPRIDPDPEPFPPMRHDSASAYLASAFRAPAPPNVLREIFTELDRLGTEERGVTWADCENAGELVKYALAVKHGVAKPMTIGDLFSPTKK